MACSNIIPARQYDPGVTLVEAPDACIAVGSTEVSQHKSRRFLHDIVYVQFTDRAMKQSRGKPRRSGSSTTKRKNSNTRSSAREGGRGIRKRPSNGSGRGEHSLPTSEHPSASLPSPPKSEFAEEELDNSLRRQRLAKKKSKLAKLNDRRKQRYEQDRLNADEQLRTNAAPFLWNVYREWAADRLTDVEVTEEEWNSDIVLSVGDGAGESLASIVKKAVGEDYSSCPEWSPSAVPSVACIAFASSAVRAVKLAKSLYDGQPVGKLFSKHLDVEEQRTWLKKKSRKALVKTAVATAKRVHLLLDNGALSLNFTKVILLDCYRDSKNHNIIDMKGPKDELFALIHEHMRPLLKQKKLKIVVHVPREVSAELT